VFGGAVRKLNGGTLVLECHSERSEESLLFPCIVGSVGIPRFARNDKAEGLLLRPFAEGFELT